MEKVVQVGRLWRKEVWRTYPYNDRDIEINHDIYYRNFINVPLYFDFVY